MYKFGAIVDNWCKRSRGFVLDRAYACSIMPALRLHYACIMPALRQQRLLMSTASDACCLLQLQGRTCYRSKQICHYCRCVCCRGNTRCGDASQKCVKRACGSCKSIPVTVAGICVTAATVNMATGHARQTCELHVFNEFCYPQARI